MGKSGWYDMVDSTAGKTYEKYKTGKTGKMGKVYRISKKKTLKTVKTSKTKKTGGKSDIGLLLMVGTLRHCTHPLSSFH